MTQFIKKTNSCARSFSLFLWGLLSTHFCPVLHFRTLTSMGSFAFIPLIEFGQCEAKDWSLENESRLNMRLLFHDPPYRVSLALSLFWRTQFLLRLFDFLMTALFDSSYCSLILPLGIKRWNPASVSLSHGWFTLSSSYFCKYPFYSFHSSVF